MKASIQTSACPSRKEKTKKKKSNQIPFLLFEKKARLCAICSCYEVFAHARIYAGKLNARMRESKFLSVFILGKSTTKWKKIIFV